MSDVRRHRPVVAVVGGYGTGITFLLSRSPGPGETLLADSVRTDHGGKGSNQAIAASRLGAQVSLLTAVGPDASGAGGRQLWEAEGVEHSCVRTGTSPTMVGAILVEPDGGNRIVVGAGSLAELGVDDVARFGASIARADVCVVSLEIPVTAACAALSAARGAGTMALLNPAPPVSLPPEALRAVDVLVPNRPEAETLTGSAPGTDPDLLMDRLRSLCAGTIVLTLGPLGALVDDGSGRVHTPAPAVATVVDTTGAGDAFIGALATGLACGLPAGSAAEVATAAASLSVVTSAVVPSLPRLADLPSALSQRLGGYVERPQRVARPQPGRTGGLA